MIFKQLFDEATWTFTYLLADEDTKQAVLIDPVVERVDEYVELVNALGLELAYTLETHVHADHVTAGAELRERLGSQTAVGSRAGAVCSDLTLEDGEILYVGGLEITTLHTPGHTQGSVSFVVDGRVFTGDTLFIGGCGRTDFQGGSSEDLYDSVHGKLFTLPDDTVVYPGHDYKGNTETTIGAEKSGNPRLGGGKTPQEFVEIMRSLQLGNPKQMARAVTANLRCGVETPPAGQHYSDLLPAQLAPIARAARIVDVRETHEWSGPLGHIPEAELVPLGTVLEESTNWNPEEPLFVVCRSGGRSSRAAEALGQRGFSRVYNLAGGMLAWNDQQLPVAR